jgi:hypothetical protein
MKTHSYYSPLKAAFSFVFTFVLVFSLFGQALAATLWVGNRLKDHNVWDPKTRNWVPSITGGITEGQVAPFLTRFDIASGDLGNDFKFQICLDYNDSGAYFFIDMKPYNINYAAVLPAYTTMDTSQGTVFGLNANIVSVTSLGLAPVAGSLCPNKYIGWEVVFHPLQAGNVYVLYGGYLAKANDPLPYPGGTFVPVNGGAGYISGVAQARIESSGTGAKTVNFKAGEIAVAEADLSIYGACPDFSTDPPYQYTFTVTNLGPGTTSSTTLTINIDSQLTYSGIYTSTLVSTAGGTITAGTCTGTTTVVCSITSPYNLLPTTVDPLSKWVVTLQVNANVNSEVLVITTGAVASNLVDKVTTNNTATCSQTTPVSLAYFKASQEGGGTRFDWSTAA